MRAVSISCDILPCASCEIHLFGDTPAPRSGHAAPRPAVAESPSAGARASELGEAIKFASRGYRRPPQLLASYATCCYRSPSIGWPPNAAGEHGGGARPRAGPRPFGSAGGGLAQPSQDRGGLHRRYRRMGERLGHRWHTRSATPPPQGPARRAQGRLPGPRTPVAALTPKRACGGALLPIQHDCSCCNVCKACSLRVRGMPPAARASMGAYPASSP